MNDIDMQVIMDLLHDVSVILKDQEQQVWNHEFFALVENVQQQMLEQYEWEQTL